MRPFFSFQWHITDECDQRCRHCYIYAGATLKKPKHMAWRSMGGVLEKCLRMADTFGRVPYFYLTGGDPLLHPHFWDLAEQLKKLKIAFAILGNPFHLDDAVCARLKDCGCEKYQLSLDGLQATHDFIRKAGSFACTLGKIPCLRKAGITSVIMTTVSGLNMEEVPQLIDTVVAHGVDVYSFARFCPENGPLEIPPLKYRQFLEICSEKFKAHENSGCATYFNKKDHLWKLYEYETGEFTMPDACEPGLIYDGCNCGNCHLTILPDGEVLACRRARGSAVGNVLRHELAQLWLHEMEKYREYTRFKKCGKCELLAWCRGCPAVAGAGSGDFYAADPQCWKEVA
ncbi:MAG: radical SAM/SPASM domain protein, ACGX system [Desulfovibrio sp.]|nr:radical SAM/SPASM domain protein, ACGX system [Desulfovibrio sp.]